MPRNKRTLEWIAFLPGIALIPVLIQAGSALYGNELVFPGAEEIGRAFLELLSRSGTWAQIGTTLVHVIQAVALSVAAGFLLGIAEGLVPFLHTLLQPLMMLLRSLPMIVLVIVIMVVARYPRVPMIAACMVLVPMISEAGYEGCIRIDPEMTDVYRLNSGINLRVIGQVYLPLVGGYMKQAAVNACGMGLKVTVTAEYLVQTKNSLGKAVYNEVYFNEYAEIYAYALIMVLLVLALTGIPAVIIHIAGKQKKGEVTIG